MIGRYEQLVGGSREGIVVHDGEFIVEVNAALLQLTGARAQEELIGRPVSSLLERPYLRAVEDQLLADAPGGDMVLVVQDRLFRVDGSVRDVEVLAQLFLEHGLPMAHVVLRDITARLLADRLRAEQAALRGAVEQVESLRRVAGGVAHQINNRLQIILGFAEMLSEQSLTRAQLGDVVEIERAASHAAAIVRQLLQYARLAPVAPEIVDLHRLVPLLLQDTTFGAPTDRVRLLCHDGSPLLVRVDRHNLREMLEQLVGNAVQAAPAEALVRVTVGTVVLRVPAEASDGQCMPAAVYATVSVRDRGAGIPPDVQRTMFDPFFTTRTVGRGVGLGLAAVQGMLAQNGGFVTFVSAPQEGSTFTVWFPVCERG
jgi:two-component system, cell cycle sensor histidine kinase and response regulator CckA